MIFPLARHNSMLDGRGCEQTQVVPRYTKNWHGRFLNFVGKFRLEFSILFPLRWLQNLIVEGCGDMWTGQEGLETCDFIKNVGVKAHPQAHAQCTNALNVIAYTMRVYVIAVLTCRVCNHGLEIKMSEPAPPVGLKLNGGTSSSTSHRPSR